VQVSHKFAAESAVFDDDNLVSSAGIVPVMRLAAQTGLSRLLGEKVHVITPRVKSGAANPAPKLATVVAGMVAGADCIDDIDVLRHRPAVLDQVITHLVPPLPCEPGSAHLFEHFAISRVPPNAPRQALDRLAGLLG
jgi:hypothetical protein